VALDFDDPHGDILQGGDGDALGTRDPGQWLWDEEAVVLLRKAEEERREADRELNEVLKLLGLSG
jgi:hypothetical protein